MHVDEEAEVLRERERDDLPALLLVCELENLGEQLLAMVLDEVENLGGVILTVTERQDALEDATGQSLWRTDSDANSPEHNI